MTTSWQHIEIGTRSDDLELGLRAPIADPLWLMGRQWQLGEFSGEDAASPIHAKLRAESYSLESFVGPGEGAPTEAMPTGLPLECRAEAMDVTSGPSAVRLAAEAGLQLIRRIESRGLDAAAAAFRAAFPLDVASIDQSLLSARERLRLTLMARRGVDGRAVYAAGDAAVDQASVASADRDLTAAALATWRAEYASRFREPAAGGATWVDEQLGYRFSMSARTQDGTVTLSAADYAGGRLDWYSFDLGAAVHRGVARAPLVITRSVLPVPLQYRGMPASRWWEFEEGTVYFGDWAAGPGDIARLIIAEFGAVYGDDWYIIPLTLPTGAIARVTALEVLDTFGGRSTVPATAVADQERSGDARSWRFCELAGDTSVASGRAPWLFLAPALASTLEGVAVERITMIRDEMANLAWGVEETIESPTGTAVSRRQQWGQDPASQAAAATTSAAEAAWRYKLATVVPPYWIPFVAERTGEGASIRLRRGRLAGWETIEAASVGAKGTLLAPLPPRALRIFEESVPSGGLEITRGWQLARGSDGKVHLWMARRKRPGRGERGSSLQMDKIET